MKNLKNKSVLIGRDPEKPRLIAAIEVGGKMKMMAIDSSVVIPNSISRCNPAERTAHCKIDIDANGELTIHNLKDANVTYVDGVAVISKHITAQSKVGLGKDCYAIDVNAILTTIKSTLGVDLSPLKRVWEEYEADLEKIAKRQQEIARRRMLPMVCTISSGLLTTVFGLIFKGNLIMTLIPVPIMVFSLILTVKNYRVKDTSMEDRKRATEKFEQNYICPACKRFVGNQKYNLLIQNVKCSKCGAAFLHE